MRIMPTLSTTSCQLYNGRTLQHLLGAVYPKWSCAMKSLVRNAWELLSILPLAACELHRVFQNQVHVDAQNPAPLKVADNIETLGHKPTIGNSEEGTYTAYLSPDQLARVCRAFPGPRVKDVLPCGPCTGEIDRNNSYCEHRKA